MGDAYRRHSLHDSCLYLWFRFGSSLICNFVMLDCSMALSRLKDALRNWGMAFLYPRPIIGFLALPRYFREFAKYRVMSQEQVPLADAYPCLADRLSRTPFDAHYFYQGAWLSRRLALVRPTHHVDIGSSVAMISVISASTPTLFLDFRPLVARLGGLLPIAGNITSLPIADRSQDSVSCLHVIEHIGLGRYGDPLDPQGSRKAASELARIIKEGGRLYVSLPVGRERVCFNAHRVHAPATVVSLFPGLTLERFSLVDDQGRFTQDASLQQAAALKYGCGLFEFRRASQ